MRCILDTNVVVSALTSRNPQSPPVQIVRMALLGNLPILKSISWKKEIKEVLSRPSILALTRKTPEELEVFLKALCEPLQPYDPISSQEAPDPKDTFLWALLEDNPDAILVTGDKKLLASGDFPGRVFSPSAFLGAFPFFGG